jgi:hypothetical protein
MENIHWPYKKDQPSLETVTIAEKLLADVFGGQMRLSDGDDLGGSNRTKVYRFAVLDGPADVPQSVIVKQARSIGDVVYICSWAMIQVLPKMPWSNLQPHMDACMPLQQESKLTLSRFARHLAQVN